MERAHIEWRNESAYDNWDEIARTLFAKIVLDSVRWAFAEDEPAIEFPEYNTTYDQYVGKAVIVIDTGTRLKNLVFHSFETVSKPFDTERAVRINDDDRIVSDHFVMLGWAEVSFSVRTSTMTVAEVAVEV